MKRFLLFFVVILSTAFVLYAQEVSPEDEGQYKLALEYSDNGNANKAIAIYNQLLEKYPGNCHFLYELAYCHYVKQDFKRAAKILGKAEKGENALAIMYALDGNCLDEMGKPKKAIQEYLEGLERCAGCGQLYLDLGTSLRSMGDYDSAVELYTKGIEADPHYSSNYYRISQLLCMSNEPVWGIIYGEIHELLSPNSRRSEELSKAIYDAYNANMKMENDSTYHVSLTSKNSVSMNGIGEPEIPFELIYEACISSPGDIDIIREKGHMDMLSLVEARRNFLTKCFASELNQEFLYPIFKYQQMVLEAGHWEAYNMWLLRKGDDVEFAAWLNANEDKFNAFVDWYNEHIFDPVEVVKK
ncbi:MAG: tetratricopeptide repeat protein [Bacteroidales bacterium]|nr:tetratricopeptide repeat protein [Bacteroidales bacterium]